MLLELSRRHYVLGQYLLAKAGCEALYLILNMFRHIEVRGIWNMRVGPERVLSLGRASGIEERRLANDHERAVGMLATPGSDSDAEISSKDPPR